MTQRPFALVVGLAALAALAAPVRAQDSPKAALAHCVAKKLAAACPDAKYGTPEFDACMKAHGGDARTACAKIADGTAPRRARTRPAPRQGGNIVRKKPGAPGYSDCMRAHKAVLEPACAAWAKERYGRGPCTGDAQKFCPGLSPEDGRKFGDCMMRNYDALVPDCREKFKKAKKGADSAKRDTNGGMENMKSSSPGEGQDGDEVNGDAPDENAQDPCIAALEKTCPELKPNDAESAQQCFKDHGSELPPNCVHRGKRKAE